MNRHEYLSLITKSERNDWSFSDENAATYNDDLSIRLVVDNNSDERVKEEWATDHPDKTNWKCSITFYYNDSAVYKLYLVGIDAGRAYLPYPDIKTKKIPRPAYLFD